MATVNVERRAQYNEILERITELSQTLSVFVAQQEQSHKSIEECLARLNGDMYGNSKKGIKEMVNRLWDDAQQWRNNGNAVLLAVIILIITNIANMLVK